MSIPGEINRRRLSLSSHILLAGGLVLVVAGLVTGELFALLLSHTLNAELRDAWQNVLALAGKAEVGAIIPRFDQIHHLATERARVMSLHSHFGPYGLLAACLALAKTRVGTAGRFDVPATVLILAGGLVQSVGFLALNYDTTSWFSIPQLGVALLLLGIALYLPGLLQTAPRAAALPRMDLAEGKLLRAGAVLVLAGLLFGLYLAWRHVYFEEPSLHAALRDLAVAVQAGDQAAASKLYATFKATQVRMAITAAAHSHALADGFIMIIAALAAEHLSLSAVWRKTAFTLIVAGGLAMPVFVYLAPRYGYIFALCADSAGGLVIVGLSIVVFGLVSPRRERP